MEAGTVPPGTEETKGMSPYQTWVDPRDLNPPREE